MQRNISLIGSVLAASLGVSMGPSMVVGYANSSPPPTPKPERNTKPRYRRRMYTYSAGINAHTGEPHKDTRAIARLAKQTVRDTVNRTYRAAMQDGNVLANGYGLSRRGRIIQLDTPSPTA